MEALDRGAVEHPGLAVRVPSRAVERDESLDHVADVPVVCNAALQEPQLLQSRTIAAQVAPEAVWQPVSPLVDRLWERHHGTDTRGGTSPALCENGCRPRVMAGKIIEYCARVPRLRPREQRPPCCLV